MYKRQHIYYICHRVDECKAFAPHIDRSLKLSLIHISAAAMLSARMRARNEFWRIAAALVERLRFIDMAALERFRCVGIAALEQL